METCIFTQGKKLVFLVSVKRLQIINIILKFIINERELEIAKGVNGVISMLYFYLNKIKNENMLLKHLVIICDNCPGYNKNNYLF